MDPYLAIILLFGGNFAMRGFQLCNGQLMAISQNAALFSLLGTYYGGNGTSTFALPDLRGRVAIQQGQAPGLSSYTIGQQSGRSGIALSSLNIPAHNHLLNAAASIAGTNSPANGVLAEPPKKGSGPSAKAPSFYTNAAPGTTLNTAAIGVNAGGGSVPFQNQMPYLGVTHVIATQGVFPSRN